MKSFVRKIGNTTSVLNQETQVITTVWNRCLVQAKPWNLPPGHAVLWWYVKNAPVSVKRGQRK